MSGCFGHFTIAKASWYFFDLKFGGCQAGCLGGTDSAPPKNGIDSCRSIPGICYFVDHEFDPHSQLLETSRKNDITSIKTWLFIGQNRSRPRESRNSVESREHVREIPVLNRFCLICGSHLGDSLAPNFGKAGCRPRNDGNEAGMIKQHKRRN